MISNPIHDSEREGVDPDPVETRDRLAGFTFVEILVAIGIGAVVIGAAALAFQTVNVSGGRVSSYESVDIGSSAMSDFYGGGSNTINAWSAPTYGRLANVDLMREKLYQDAQRAVAVHCLPRAGRSTIRPTTLTTSGALSLTTRDPRRLSTPEEFRQFLVAAVPSASSVFTADAYGTAGAVKGQNLSIMVLTRSSSADSLAVYSVYEVDFMRATSPAGTYATVRRYQGGTLTDFYDVLYPDKTDGTTVNSTDFYVAANFERAGRTNTYDLKFAAKNPFYLVWWPDPAASELPPSGGADYKATMSGQTPYMMVLPMFPAL